MRLLLKVMWAASGRHPAIFVRMPAVRLLLTGAHRNVSAPLYLAMNARDLRCAYKGMKDSHHTTRKSGRAYLNRTSRRCCP